MDLHAGIFGLVRIREEGRPSAGARLSLQGNPSDGRFFLHGEAYGYAQWLRPEDGLDPVEGSATARVDHRPGPSTWVPGAGTSHALEAFARTLSLTGAEVGAAEPALDQDVFTRYKSDHRAGIRLVETVTFAPWLDTRLWIRGELASNEDLDPSILDYAGGRAGLHLLAGGWRLAADYRLRHYLSDDDRARGVLRDDLHGVVAWESWLDRGDRLAVELRIRHDLDARDTSGSLTASWHVGRGRGLTDFRPGSEAFRDLRERRRADRTTPVEVVW